MQNDLKYGELSEMCGINGYFAGAPKTLRRQKFSSAGKEIHTSFKGGGGKNSTFSKNILPWELAIES